MKLEIHQLKQTLEEIENKKQNYYIDNFTQTNVFNKNLTLDKHTQTNKLQTFDTFTQTLTKDLFNKPAAEIGIQCNRLVFTKNISTQTQFEEAKDATSKANAQYLDNKLNDLLKQSFNNYTNRNTNKSESPLNDGQKNKIFKFQIKNPTASARQKQQQINFNDNLTLRALNQNFNSSSASKRVRISESTLEIHDLEDEDYRQLNQDF